MPQPQRKPHPPIVNAGTSSEAREMVAQYCDWSFVCPMSYDQAREMVEDIKTRGEKYNRTVKVVTMAQPVWDSDAGKARAERDKVIENMDPEGWRDGQKVRVWKVNLLINRRVKLFALDQEQCR